MRLRFLSYLLLAVGCQRAPGGEHCARARALGVSAYTGSVVRAEGLEPGKKLDCRSQPLAYENAILALEVVPIQLRPERVELHVEPELTTGAPKVTWLEAERRSRALIAANDALEVGANRSVWLHEIAHLRALGTRPEAPLARRVLWILEEGYADYFAAVLTDSAAVGERKRELRDLENPPRIGESEWARLALPQAFDAHRFGWAFAAELFRASPAGHALLEDLADALASGRSWPSSVEGPRDVLAELVRRCPERSRKLLEDALVRFVPPELRRG